MHVLYLFAGVERKADVQHYLIELAKRDNVSLKGLQLDILRNEGHNLHKEEVWAWVSQQLQEGRVDLFAGHRPATHIAEPAVNIGNMEVLVRYEISTSHMGILG